MKKVASLLAVLSVCVFVRIWLIGHTDAIAADGVTYVQMAREWVVDPAGVVRNYEYHVGYPAAMAGGHSILESIPAAEGIGSWDLAGQAVSLVASVTAMMAVWVFARMAFDSDKRIAWLTVLLFGVSRKWAGLGADVLSDASAVCMQMWAVVLSLMVLRQLAKKNKWAILVAAGVGLTTGLGYLVRPEALLVAGLSIGFWLTFQIRRRWSWPLTLGCVGMTVTAAMLCVMPYMLAIGTLTKKRSISQIIMAPVQVFNPQPCLAMLLTGEYSSIRVFVNQFAEAQHPVLAALLCVCLAVWLGKNVLRISLPQKMTVSAEHISGLFMIAASVAVIFMLTGLHGNMGYLSYRHAMFLAALLSPLAGAGFVILVELIKNLAVHLKCPQKIGGLIMPAAITALTLGLLAHTLRPLHEGKQYCRRAGYFIGAFAAEGEYVLAEQPRVIHYAQAVKAGIKGSGIPKEELNQQDVLELARQRSANYLVLSASDLAEDISQSKNPTFSQVSEFPQLEQDFGRSSSKKRKLDTLTVYRIDYPAQSAGQ